MLNFDEFKWARLLEKHALATWSLRNYLSISLKTEGNQGNLRRDGRSQDISWCTSKICVAPFVNNSRYVLHKIWQWRPHDKQQYIYNTCITKEHLYFNSFAKSWSIVVAFVSATEVFDWVQCRDYLDAAQGLDPPESPLMISRLKWEAPGSKWSEQSTGISQLLLFCKAY